MGIQVHILGPNLPQPGPTFHVHGKECADLHKRIYASPEFDWDRKNAYEFESLEALVKDVYQDQLAESDYPWNDLISDFKIFPCAKELV